jgi:hypothetical protein
MRKRSTRRDKNQQIEILTSKFDFLISLRIILRFIERYFALPYFLLPAHTARLPPCIYTEEICCQTRRNPPSSSKPSQFKKL